MEYIPLLLPFHSCRTFHSCYDQNSSADRRGTATYSTT